MPLPLPSSLYLRQVRAGALSSDPCQLQALEHLDQIRQHLDANDSAGALIPGWLRRRFKPGRDQWRGCYLWGGVGTGKSLLMDLFHESLGRDRSTRIHFHRFMQSIHDQKAALKQVQDPLQHIARDIATTSRVLCLDEFMVTDITDAMILAGLVRSLFANGCFLITTSNTPIAELYRGGLQRDRFLPAIELLQQRLRQVHVDPGLDYRMRCLKDGGTYHIPADAEANARMEATFTRLGGGAEQTADAVLLNHRHVPVVRVCRGAIWFEFDHLCRTQRASADYIEIARQYHTVLLANLPLMTVTDDDAARRFINLVDEFYDRHVNLIVSSNHPPQQLYRGKRLAKPFERTCSRLVEMGSTAYLGKPHVP